MHKKIILAVLAIITTFLIISCTKSDNLPKQEQRNEGKISSPLGAELFVEDEKLVIGQTTKLTLRAFIEEGAYSEDPNAGYSSMPNVTMKFELPNNLEYVSGELSWQGDIEGDIVKEIGIIVRAKDIGYVKVSGSAISYHGTSYWGGIGSKKICMVKSSEESCTGELINTTGEMKAEYKGPFVSAIPNKANIIAEVLEVNHSIAVSKLKLKIIKSEDVEGYRNIAKVGETIEVSAYQEKFKSNLQLPNVKAGDKISAIVSLRGDEKGISWIAEDIIIISG